MRAIVLAAGRGGRLRGVTGALPKCLARVGSCTLLERQLSALRACGIDDVTVVAGYRASAVRRVCGHGIGFVHNTRFASTNSLYSLWLARDLLTDGFVVLNCDVLFPQQLLEDLMTARYDDALLVAARGGDHYSDEEMKVRIRRGRVDAISKTLDPADADGENIGIGKFSRSGAAVMVEEMDRLLADGGVREWLPAAFERLCHRIPLWAIESRGLPWIEIDFPEDYWRACGEILPAIEALDSPPSHPAIVARDATNAASGRTRHHV
jgi:choline kinase